MMKSLLFLTLVLFPSLWVQANPLEEKTMYAIIVGDIGEASGIGGGVQQDINRVYNELRSIAHLIDYSFEHEIITEEERFHKDTILQEIQKIPANAGIIVFYYSGHGYCVPNNNMPFLKVNGGLKFQKIINTIREKQARFTLLLTDCCNEAPPKDYDSGYVSRSGPDETFLKNINHLFTTYQGEVIATASRYGQKAYIGPEGSYFTDVFFDTLEELGPYVYPLYWENLFKQVQTSTVEIVEKEKMDSQKPYYTINIQAIQE